MDLKKNFQTDHEKEVAGVWVAMDHKTSIKVARIGNPEYRKTLNTKMTPFKASLRQGILPEETATKVLIEAMAETILLDWQGMEEGGEEVPYSKDNAKRLLTDYEPFRTFVQSAAEEAELFKLQETEEAVKN